MRGVIVTLLLALPAGAVDFNDPRAVVAAAEASSPTLTRLRAEAQAARQRVAPAASLPNPMLMAGVQNKQVDLRDDEMMTMYMVGISQTMVRPDKREAMRSAAELEARAAERMVDAARAELERDVLLAWYDVAAIDAQIAATAPVREMIDAVIAAARVRYEVGTSLQADVVRAQLQGSELDHELLRLRGERRAALARLLPLVGLPVTDVPSIALPEIAAAIATDIPPDHPALLALESEAAAAEEEIRVARLEGRPDVDLEAQYGYRAMQRDTFSVVARIELPLRAAQLTEPRVREAMLRRDAARARIEETRRTLARAMAEAQAAHEEAAEQLRFHHEVLMPQAQLAFESTLAAYQTGRTMFEAVLETQTDYLRLRLQSFDFVARQAQAAVVIDALRRGATGGMR